MDIYKPVIPGNTGAEIMVIHPHLIQFLFSHCACIFGHLHAEFIIVAVNIFKPEVCPEEVLILNPVLAEGHLHPVIKLTRGRIHLQQAKNGECQYEEFFSSHK